METKNSLRYLRFLNLVDAINRTPAYPKMDSLEERLLNAWALSWQAGKKLTVLEAMGVSGQISPTTVHRRLKSLQKKGLIELTSDETDGRVKYVIATDTTTEYFTALGQAMTMVQQD